jgi:diguanylate cyclase
MVMVKRAYDPLTGLETAPAFRETLAAQLDSSDTVTLAVLDADHFMELNETLGHEAGDSLLRAVGERLRAFASEVGGAAGRLGGDEFAVTLPGASLENGFLALERFRAAVTTEAGLVPGHADYKFSLSAGIANHPRDARTAADLVARADQALWAAKESGRNQVALPAVEEMVLKTCYYTHAQVGRLRRLSEKQAAKESVLLREALDDLLRKYDVK